jgi:Gas vesicle synthesis protein GvpL/GvpF
MTEHGLGTWLYAVGVDLDGPWISDVRGVAGEALRLVSAAGLTALVGSVDLDRFGEDGLRRSLNDLDQLEAIARAHHGVIRMAALNRPAAPARLATIYADDSRVLEMLERHGPEFTAAIRRVRGRQEWGVKAYAAHVPASAEPEPPRPASGTAYLRQRQAALSAVQVSRQAAASGAEEIHARLAGTSVGSRQHRPQDANLTGDDRAMILNGAYLVDEERTDEFAATVSSLADDHKELDVELTGPWPPYSFAVIDDGAKT